MTEAERRRKKQMRGRLVLRRHREGASDAALGRALRLSGERIRHIRLQEEASQKADAARAMRRVAFLCTK